MSDEPCDNHILFNGMTVGELRRRWYARPRKGERGGTCNRTACGESPADYWNPSTRAHYCAGCAHAINLYNPGLCVPAPTADTKESEARNGK